MTICPIAIAVGCKKCPVFSVCPMTKIIGDQGGSADKSAAGTSGNAADTTKTK